MNNGLKSKKYFPAGLRFLAMLTVLALSLQVNAQGVLSRPQTGTVQELRQDDGYLIISGRRVGFDNELAQIFLDDEPQGAEILDEGMVVRYTVDSGGNLLRLEILGPIDKIRILQDN